MRRKIALKKLLAVATGSLLIVGGAALASAAASGGQAPSTDTGSVALSDPVFGSAIDDVVVANDPAPADEATDTSDDVSDADQGNVSDDDQGDVSDDDQGSED
jgi:hypothetical protein